MTTCQSIHPPTLTNLTFSCSLASSSNASFICWHGCDHGAQKWTTTKLFGDGRGGSVIKPQISNTHVHSFRHEGKVHKLLVSRGRFISSLSPLDYLGSLMILAHDSSIIVLHYFSPHAVMYPLEAPNCSKLSPSRRSTMPLIVKAVHVAIPVPWWNGNGTTTQ